MKKIIKTLIMIMLLTVFFIPSGVNAWAEGGNGTNSITVDIVDIYTKVPLQGIELYIYKVADENNNRLIMTDEFKNSGVTSDEFYDYEKSELATLKLDEYIKKAGIEHLQSSTSDQNGKAYFGGLTDGMYMVKHNRTGASQGEDGHTFSMSTFLVHAPRLSEDGSREPNVVCKPKGFVEDETYVNTTRVVNKVWKDNSNVAGVRPKEIIVGLFNGETLAEKVSLNDGNNWTYKWAGLEEGPDWVIKELTVLDRYQSTVEVNGVVYTITNTLKDTPSKGPNTGDKTNILVFVIAGACSGVGIVLAIFLKRKKSK